MVVAPCVASGLLSHRAVAPSRGIFGWWPRVLSCTWGGEPCKELSGWYNKLSDSVRRADRSAIPDIVASLRAVAQFG